MNLTKISWAMDLKPGDIVYDEKAKVKGKVVDVRESRGENIDAYVVWDGTDKEECLTLWPHIKLVA